MVTTTPPRRVNYRSFGWRPAAIDCLIDCRLFKDKAEAARPGFYGHPTKTDFWRNFLSIRVNGRVCF